MQATADPHLRWRLLDTLGQVRVSLGQSVVRSLLLSPGSWCSQGFLCALLESVSPVLCKFWWLYGGVNGDLLQEGLCHTQVYCTQSPCPCSSPLLTGPPQETPKYSSVSVSGGSLGPGAPESPGKPLNAFKAQFPHLSVCVLSAAFRTYPFPKFI